jgi:hypothetical protein
MTRKDFQALAEILAQTKCEMEDGFLPKGIIYENLQDEVIAFCKRSNPNFDKGRFVEAVEAATK